MLRPETEIMKETPWSRIKGQNSVDKEFLEIVGNGKPTGSVLKETIAVSVTISISVQKRHSRIRLRVLSCNRMREMRREPEVPEEKVPVGEWLDCRARTTSKELAPIHSVKNGTLQNACSTKPRVVADLGETCSYAHRQVDEQPTKRSKKNDDKSAVAMLQKPELHDRTGQLVVNRDTRHESNHGPLGCSSSSTRQLGCVFQDMVPRRSSSILRKNSDIRKPIRCVKFTKAVLRHANIRNQNPWLGMFCPGEPHQRSPNAPKFEDRSQEETEWQEQGAREAAWKLAKSVLKIKEKNKATFFSPSENRCLPASTLKPEERELVVDPGASMHMISKKGLE